MEKDQSQLQQIAVFQDEEKQRQMELQELREEVQRLRLQYLDESKYAEWGPVEIAAWIINLDQDRLKKYEKTMETALKEEEADGSLLEVADAGDLRGWGIQKREDRKFVQQHIDKLVKGNAPQKGGPKVAMEAMDTVEDEGAPTAFV